MKKGLITAVILATASLTACANQAPQNQVFGYTGPKNLTISEVKQQYDDAQVIFTGKIVRQVSNDHYVVADSTGEIQVEIDDHVWNGLNVTAADTIRIYGEVDKDTFSTKVDAGRVEKVQ